MKHKNKQTSQQQQHTGREVTVMIGHMTQVLDHVTCCIGHMTQVLAHVT